MLEGIHLFKIQNEEDEQEIIDNLLFNEDHFIRFMPPELVQEPQLISVKNDVWMLGCLMIEILSKSRVWEGFNESEILKQLKSQMIPKIPNDIHPDCWGLMCECLNPFPKSRIDIRDVITRYYYLLGKLGMYELQDRMQSNQILSFNKYN